MPGSEDLVSVVIPARDEEASIGSVVTTVLDQAAALDIEAEVVLVDDGSSDATAAEAAAAGARVVSREGPGNPAAARNLGASAALGDPIIFLDADCTPREGWMDGLLTAYERGESCVGGSLALPAGLSTTARWDFYCGWYHAHPRRTSGYVPNHPPGNLSVSRDLFVRTRGFTERQPIAYAHEELEWQAQIQSWGHRIYFEPRAVVEHRNRSGLANLLARNYRWGYCALESKAASGAARLAGLYRHPGLLILATPLLIPAQSTYIVWCWLRAGVLEPALVFPAVLAARTAYAFGMALGGLRWLRRRRRAHRLSQERPAL